MTEIKYAFSLRQDNWDNDDLNSWADYLEEQVDCPQSLIKEVSENRKGVVFFKCPAHTDFLKNTYVFKSPFDIFLNIETVDNTVRIWSENIAQPLFEKFIDVRFLNQIEGGASSYPIVGIDFLNLFVADTTTLMSVTPAFLHYNDFTDKTSVIPGEFDISKWVRPVECVFEIKKQTESIKILKGDALCYFKFRTDDSNPIKITRSQMPWKTIDQCAKLRAAEPLKPLKFRYDSFKKNNV
jgi:hypothetical protein